MKFSDLPTNPDQRVLRQFAALWILFFGSIGAIRIYNASTMAIPLLVLAFGAGLTGLAWPKILRPVFVTWMVVVFPIGWIVSHMILAAVYFGIFTPLGLILRARGHNSLKLERRDSGTYWRVRNPPQDASRYFKQF